MLYHDTDAQRQFVREHRELLANEMRQARARDSAPQKGWTPEQVGNQSAETRTTTASGQQLSSPRLPRLRAIGHYAELAPR